MMDDLYKSVMGIVESGELTIGDTPIAEFFESYKVYKMTRYIRDGITPYTCAISGLTNERRLSAVIVYFGMISYVFFTVTSKGKLSKRSKGEDKFITIGKVKTPNEVIAKINEYMPVEIAYQRLTQ